MNNPFTAFRLEYDESFNAMKALLVLNGYELYESVWNDQPPVLNWIHVEVMRSFGIDIVGLRWLAIMFSGGLLMSLYMGIRRFYGTCAAAFSTGIVLLSSGYLQLSFACLIGLPAYAFAMAACSCLICAKANTARIWITLSGILLALGAQTKLSALLAVPGILVWLWLLPSIAPEVQLGRRTALALWSGGFVLVWTGIWVVSGESVELIAVTHWGSITRSAYAEVDSSFAILMRLLTQNWVLACMAIAGLAFGLVRNRNAVLLPGIWLTTALIVHLWHRPFWHLQFINLSIPMAWLAGLFVGEMVEQFKALTWEQLVVKKKVYSAPDGGWGTLRAEEGSYGTLQLMKDRWKSLTQSRMMAWMWILLPTFFLSAFFMQMPARWKSATAFTKMDDSTDWQCVDLMKRYKARTRWVFTDDGLYPFHAGILVPPEIAVLSNKRLNSQAISQPELLNLLAHYRPEQIIVKRHRFDKKFMDYVQRQYTLIFLRGMLELYVRNDLLNVSAHTNHHDNCSTECATVYEATGAL